MKVKLLNSTDGMGAGIACLRLLEALENSPDVDPELIVQKQKTLGKENVKVLKNSTFAKIPYLIRTIFSELSIKWYTKSLENFSTGRYGVQNIRSHVEDSDVIHLHWINDSFISLNGLNKISELNKPVFWTLRDLWPITGGCHYSGDCHRFTTYCHECPELGSDREKDLSYNIWHRKKQVYKRLNPVFIAPSQWMADQVKSSSLGAYHNVHVINNPIDHKLFRPNNQAESRKFFGLPFNKRFLLFGAINPLSSARKGFNELRDALNVLEKQNNLKKSNVEILIFGTDSKPDLSSLSTSCHVLGNIKSEEALIHCYNAADFFVIPSLQDNHPKTIMEAMACGVPSIGFDTGGIPEMIDHNRTGFIAKKGNVKSLAVQLSNAIELNQEKLDSMKELSRKKVVDHYTYDKIATQHLALYRRYLS